MTQKKNKKTGKAIFECVPAVASITVVNKITHNVKKACYYLPGLKYNDSYTLFRFENVFCFDTNE